MSKIESMHMLRMPSCCHCEYSLLFGSGWAREQKIRNVLFTQKWPLWVIKSVGNASR